MAFRRKTKRRSFKRKVGSRRRKSSKRTRRGTTRLVVGNRL